jgi:redox-sensitive bicupin YhaK (pirin superfamily)
MSAQSVDELTGNLQIVSATSFYRLTEAEFGMPGLVAIESVGPFVELARVGPFITIHDSFLDPGLGIGHHPHRGNERLFYILRGEIRHDDALNRIQGVMNEGDLARLTEGEIGMLHREWNGREDVRTHAFILVYTPDAEPPIERAAFNAIREHEVPRHAEARGVETLELIGGQSTFAANNSAITTIFDSTLDDAAQLELEVPPAEGLILYPLEGAVRLTTEGDEARLLRGSSQMHPEGPDELAIVWSDIRGRVIRLSAEESGARVLRIGFTRRDDDMVVHEPWRRSR